MKAKDVIKIVEEWMPDESIKRRGSAKSYSKKIYSMSEINHGLRESKKDLIKRINQLEEHPQIAKLKSSESRGSTPRGKT